jgi:hypothetical protein
MYYPKSQIKTDLYTNGGQYALSTSNQDYKGYYYEISNGEKYTGRNPQDGPNILLTEPLPINNPTISNTTTQTPTQQIIYTVNESVSISLPNRTIPQFNPTIPTDSDKSLGVFSRYFCKKTNELIYLEINKQTYDQLNNKNPNIAWDLYTPQLVLWQIKGDQEQTYLANKNNVSLLEQKQKWYGFSQYFKEDFSKYYVGE